MNWVQNLENIRNIFFLFQMHYIWVLLSTIVGLIMTNARIVFPSPTDNFQAETDDDNMPPPWRDQVYQKNLLPPDDSLDFMLTSSSKYDKAMPESLQKFPFVPPERIARQLVLITVQHPMLIIQGKFYHFPSYILRFRIVQLFHTHF